jgi:monofunctional biosynthetic peptidoglycan transglycosylase
MKAISRWIALVLVAAAVLEFFFLARIALSATVDPQSTSFQRSEAWRITTQKGQWNKAPASPRKRQAGVDYQP